MKMMSRMYLVVLCLVICLFTFVSAQSRRYRNPWVNVVRRHSCATLTCPRGQTCDLSYENCRTFGPCLLKEPACVTATGIPRRGSCPQPNRYMITMYTVDCFDDGGCDAPQVCCHSYAGSYCWFPRTRQTVRSRIPRFTNRSVRRITETG